jgi:hypothetical protein
MDYSYILFLIGILVLVISFGVILNIKLNKERFESEQPMLSLSKCGRNITFANFSSTNLAAQRAANDLEVTKNISRGTCNIPLNNEGIDKTSDTYSVVKDNYIFYSLKRTCIGMKYSSIIINNNNSVSITFETNTEADKKTLLYFILLNPIFVEFSFDSNNNTVAYYPVFDNNVSELMTDPRMASKDFQYSTTRGRRDNKITFNVVLPIEEKGRDSLFNYNPHVTLANITHPPKGVINIQLYFLDDKIPTSYQNVGKQLSHPNGGDVFLVPHLFKDYRTNQSDLLVFRTDYNDRFSQNAAYKDVYEFNNNINIFFKNYVQPVFTVSMDLLVTDLNIWKKMTNQNIVIARMFMDNSYGNYTNCSAINQELLNVYNNNIFMVIIEVGNKSTNTYNICIVSGKGGSCNYPFTDRSNVRLTVPYLTNTSHMKLTFTLSPNEKIVTAFWKDTNTLLPQTALSRANNCADDLNLARLFKQQPHQAPIGNIKMNVNNNIVSKLNYVALGYKNLVTEYEKFI